MIAAATAERSERFTPLVGVPGSAGALVRQAATAGVRLEARPEDRLWADRPELLSPDLRTSLAAHRPAVLQVLVRAAAERDVLPAPPSRPSMAVCIAALPGVPATWCEGVSLLSTLTIPDDIAPHRWALFLSDAARLLHEHGAELKRAGWDALDVFGLHRLMPQRRPDCMGLAWLLDDRGIGLITPETAAVIAAGGHTLRAWRMGQQARREAVPAWALVRTECELDGGGE